MNFFVIIVALNLFVCPLNTHCLLAESPSNEVQESTQDVTVDQHEKLCFEKYNLYLSATFQHNIGEMQDSLQSFSKLLKNEAPVEMYDGFVRFLFDADQYEAIAQLPDNIWIQFNDDLEVQLIRAKALLQTNRLAQASKFLTYLQVKYPDDEQVNYYAIAFHMQKGEHKQAILLVDRALANKALEPKHFLFYHLKSKILLSMGKPKEAIALAEKSVELFPRFSKGWLFKALLLEQLGQINAAIRGYERFLDLVGSHEAVEKQLINLMFAHGRYSQAEEQLKKMAERKPEYFYELAMMKWKTGKQTEAFEYVEKILKKKPHFTQAKLLKIEILLSLRQHNKVLAVMQKWLKNKPSDKIALQTLFLLRKADVSVDALIQMLKGLNADHNGHSRIILALADLHLEKHDYQAALPLYERLSSRAKGSLMKSKVLFQQAYIYYVTQDFAKMMPILKKAVSLQPAYPSAYNLLAYYYAETNKTEHFAEALDLSERALESCPTSHSFMDTQGLVLLKLGNKKKAAKLFQKALELAGNQDATILKHLELAHEEQ